MQEETGVDIVKLGEELVALFQPAYNEVNTQQSFRAFPIYLIYLMHQIRRLVFENNW